MHLVASLSPSRGAIQYCHSPDAEPFKDVPCGDKAMRQGKEAPRVRARVIAGVKAVAGLEAAASSNTRSRNSRGMTNKRNIPGISSKKCRNRRSSNGRNTRQLHQNRKQDAAVNNNISNRRKRSKYINHSGNNKIKQTKSRSISSINIISSSRRRHTIIKSASAGGVLEAKSTTALATDEEPKKHQSQEQ